MRDYGPWKVLATTKVYQDPWIRVRKDDVLRPDGKPGTYSVVDLKPGVCVVAVDDRSNVHLTEEFHYGVGRVTLEGVSGGIDTGEDAFGTAQRELREELGITAAEWIDLGACDPFTGSVVSPTRLYLAQRLSFGSTDHEGTETIAHRTLPLADALAKVGSEITHGPTCIALLLAARHR